MPNHSYRLGTLPETGYVRQSQLIPVIFPFSPATLWRKVKAGTFPRPVKLSPRIGGNAGTASPLPPKPKGMWRRTYERLREQAFDAEERADEALLPHLARLLARTNNRKNNNRKGKRSFWK